MFWIKESTLLSNLWKSMEPHTTIKKKKKERENIEIRNVITQSPNKRVLSYTFRAKKQNYSLDRGRAWARRQLPTPKIECFRNTLPLIFKTECVLSRPVSSPLPLALSIHVLVCSQMLTSPCQTEIRGGHSEEENCSPSFRPGGSWVLCSWGLTASMASPGTAAPPPASGVASRPSSHTLSIRCVYFLPDSRHIWSTYSGYSSATRHIPQDHFSGCYGDLPPSSDLQVAWQK